ncbi:hypothetical protein QJS04_geneDACA017111 [Acorus gramineus]|uniref:Uncharacterized protein n=1 Tax=Acorus gramineus TaxID=55184 RepID=A0AAV9AWW5_ACOGR|nr:hypothetical protein QJS04_geneDACA017111 [Acorus gramineus]
MAEVLLEGYLQIMTEPTREVNNVLYDTDESTDEEHITMDQVLDLTHAQSEKLCEGEAALEQLKTRVTEQKKEITKLENMSKMDSKALKHLRESTKALEEQKSELQSRLRSLEEEKEKLITKAKVVADLQEEIWALQQDTDSATRRIQNLTDELENMTKLKEDQEDSRKCENAEHKSEKNKLNQRLWGVEKQKKKLELDKVEANAKIEQLSMNNQQVKEEILRMALKMSVNEDISEKLKKAEEELDDLKRDMKLKGEEIERMRCERVTKDEEVAALTCKLGALNNEIQLITKERNKLKGSNRQLWATNEGLKQVVQSKDAKMEELKVKAQECLNYERWWMSHVVGMLEGQVFAWMNNMGFVHSEWSGCLVELQSTRQSLATPSSISFE